MFGCWFAAAPEWNPSTIVRACAPRCRRPRSARDRASRSRSDDESGIAAAVAAAREADIVILCARRDQGDDRRGARPRPHRSARPPARAGRGGAGARQADGRDPVRTAGRSPLPWLFERADAVLATWFLGSQAGHGIADVLTGAWNPSGRLPVTWPLRRRPDPDLLCAAPDRPPGRARRVLLQPPHRPADRAAVPLRPRPVLHALCA